MPCIVRLKDCFPAPRSCLVDSAAPRGERRRMDARWKPAAQVAIRKRAPSCTPARLVRLGMIAQNITERVRPHASPYREPQCSILPHHGSIWTFLDRTPTMHFKRPNPPQRVRRDTTGMDDLFDLPNRHPPPPAPLIDDELWSVKVVRTKTGLSRASIYKYVEQGLFPRQRHLGPGRVAWRASDVRAWIASRPE